MIKTVIQFEYDGSYVNSGDGYQWTLKEPRAYAIMFKTSTIEDITCSAVKDRICKKMGVDRATTQMRLSYMSLASVAAERKPIYIVDDEDVESYLSSMGNDRCRNALYVEVLTGEARSSFGVNYGDMDSNARANEAIIIYEKGVEHSEALENDGVGDAENIARDEVDDDVNEDVNEVVNDDVDENVNGDEGEGVNEDGNEDLDEDLNEDLHDDGNDGFGLDALVVLPRDEEGNQLGEEWGDGTGLELGQEFASRDEVQNILISASHDECFEFKILNTDTRRYVVKCREAGCNWYIRVARPKKGEGGSWKVSVYRKMHTCSRASASTTTTKRKGTAKLVASVVRKKFPGSLETPSANSLIGVVQREVGVVVSYATALRGKKKATDFVRGNPEESYKMLPSYLCMLEKMNIGTVTRLVLDEENKFKYLFVALGACIEGFRGMRKVLSVDATFLKSAHGGVLIIATAQDPNHHHYPIAFAVVDGEKDESWNWFFTMLKNIISDGPELVFLTDRNASLIKAISDVYPRSSHGFCMFHLSQNVRTKVSNTNKEEVAKKFRELAQIYTEVDFKKEYEEFRRRFPKVAQYLDNSVEEAKWARCYFPGERYNINTTNSSESLNNVFKDARKYSLLHMIDTIVDKIAEWFNKHRKESAGGSSSRKLVPFVENDLHVKCKIAKKLKVRELNTFLLEYSVIGFDGKNYLVDLRKRSCACKCFDIDKIPCVHAIAALLMYMKNEDRPMDMHLHELCSHYYLMEQWALAYYRTIYPVPHKSQWFGIPEDVQALLVLPPNYTKRKGRLQVTRHPSVGEKRRKTSNKAVAGVNLGKFFECSTRASGT